MEEDKQKILDLLLPALQSTNYLHDLESLEYDESKELVYAKFPNEFRIVVDVALSSGLAMIRDVIGRII